MLKSEELKYQFALNAPVEIPDWFDRIEPEKIEEPLYWTRFAHHRHQNLMRQWHHGDNCFSEQSLEDKPHLKTYIETWTQYRRNKEMAEKKAEQETYFNWRRFYAEQMIKVLEQ